MRKAMQWCCAFLLMFASLSVWAVQGGPNTADIIQNVHVPGMAITINPGGIGCNTAAHEVWEPAQGGCSDIEYQKSTARVVSVTASTPSIDAGTGSTGFVAQVVTANGKVAPPGVVVKWAASNGNLAVPQGVTDGSGQAKNTLSGASAGSSTVTANAAGGGASTQVTVESPAPTINGFAAVGIDQQGRRRTNVLYFDGYYGGGAFGYRTEFTWGALGADRYVVLDYMDRVVYSGAGNIYIVDDWVSFNRYYPSSKYLNKYTLRAYKGAAYSESVIWVTGDDRGCYSCGN